MMILGRYAILILAALYGMGSCDAAKYEVKGSNNVVTEERKVGEFTGVALMTVGDLEIEIANRKELQIEAEDNLLSWIETEVIDGVLVIRQRGNTPLSPSQSVRYRVTMRRLERIVHSAGGQVHLPSVAVDNLYVKHNGSGLIEAPNLDVDALSLHASGSGDVELGHVAAQRCRLILSGSGDVKVRELTGLSNTVRLTGSGDLSIAAGSVVRQSAFVSGSGDLTAKGLDTTETEVMVSGAGSASIQAQDHLDATITGRGSIRYRGDPQVIKSISGSGKLKTIR